MRALALVIVLAFGGFLGWATFGFPAWGDPDSPASRHVSPYYLENAMEDTSAPNVVTAVLADYRGFDTMFETTVIFAAGVACFLLLRILQRREPEEFRYRHLPTDVIIHVKKGVRLKADPEFLEQVDADWTPSDVIVRLTSRLLIPFIQLFALYVVAHGHHSPGGGFQGGVILGASLILMAISHDLRTSGDRLSESSNGILSVSGVLIFVGVGAVCLFMGVNFLDYSGLAPLLGVDRVEARSLGILFVEIGVALAVMGTMVAIYRNISSAGTCEEGL